MLLTLPAPAKPEFEFKSPHDFPSTFTSAPKRLSPPSFVLPASHPTPADSVWASMSTPHRGLPPPAAMTLPDPQRGPPPITPSLGQMPAPPSQWQGAEDSMRNWLAAKAEEDKRKQEEEKTRQESLRLEQRKIESNMLRDSMAGGIPPHMVPIIFAGIGGASLANASIDWLQQYATQVQASQQHALAAPPHHVSPEVRRDSRTLISQGPYAPTSQPPAPASVLSGQPAPSYTYSPGAGGLSPQHRARQLPAQGPTSAPRSALPRLTTNEMHTPQAPTLQSAPSQEATASSPSIYFHHWVPPSSQVASGSGSSKDQPATPTDYTSSPKKRKDARPHQAAPLPTSVSQSHTSASFVHASSTTSTPPAGTSNRSRHTRNRSDFVSGQARVGRLDGRHRTPSFSARIDAPETARGRTASESVGSRGFREDRARQAAMSVPGSPRAKYERH